MRRRWAGAVVWSLLGRGMNDTPVNLDQPGSTWNKQGATTSNNEQQQQREADDGRAWSLLRPRQTATPNQAKTSPKKPNNNPRNQVTWLPRPKGERDPGAGLAGLAGRVWLAAVARTASSARHRGDVTLPWVSCPFHSQLRRELAGPVDRGLGALWGATQALLLQWAWWGRPRGCLFAAGCTGHTKP